MTLPFALIMMHAAVLSLILSNLPAMADTVRAGFTGMAVAYVAAFWIYGLCRIIARD